MKRFLYIIGVFVVVSLCSFFNADVRISMELPSKVVAGTDQVVTLMIEKGDLEGFARFQQDLPFGVTALPIKSANADFSFENGKVRLIWLKLPKDPVLEVSYLIQANERVQGEIELGGSFSYIENNTRKTSDLTSKMLAIEASPKVDASMVVDIKDYSRIASMTGGQIGQTAGEMNYVACLRQFPVWSDSEGGYIVNLLVNKAGIKKFAKIEDKVPSGYTAEGLDTNGSVFQFKNGIAQFVWQNVPQSNTFMVAYKLVPKVGTTPNSSVLHMDGAFSYTVQNVNNTIAIKECQEDLKALSAAEIKKVLASVGEPVMVAGLQSSSSNKTEVPKTTTKTTSGQVAKTSGGKSTGVSNQYALVPEQGVYYRVQIAAGHKPANPQRIFRKYKLNYTVAREEHEGWYKYSVGSFHTYKDARDYRVELSSTTSLKDAFIAAYSDGKRIPVQEALMALNQKWYR